MQERLGGGRRGRFGGTVFGDPDYLGGEEGRSASPLTELSFAKECSFVEVIGSVLGWSCATCGGKVRDTEVNDFYRSAILRPEEICGLDITVDDALVVH